MTFMTAICRTRFFQLDIGTFLTTQVQLVSVAPENLASMQTEIPMIYFQAVIESA